MRIAFVCHGNICRSPMAETVARTLVERAGLSGEVTVESYGTSGYHAGAGADARAVAALARAGWPARAHHARQLTPASIEAADLVLCADRENLSEVRHLAGRGAWRRGDGSVDGDLDGKVQLLRAYDPVATPVEDDEVPDPWYGGAADFDTALAMIERSCHELVDELVATRR